ncbi:hypothetical protein F6X40_41230 [Paraburkholderia sp. UCT31]|uniref:hypothetical protein n=1 Tax=Paraburkholderia sp. UCT31 TaxID=2615209 RepID=UPI0016559FB1|nr:hypothetical protein [Paraburkholderia sp. UCT31]MBC8742889.1 hypothetical protein [Paraburkholderia sp. UCT31]
MDETPAFCLDMKLMGNFGRLWIAGPPVNAHLSNIETPAQFFDTIRTLYKNCVKSAKMRGCRPRKGQHTLFAAELQTFPFCAASSLIARIPRTVLLPE